MFYRIRSKVLTQHVRQLILVLFVFLSFGIMSSAIAQEPITSAPTLVSQAWFPGLSIGEAFSEALVVIEFPPGAGVPLHTHGGPHLVIVLEGAITVSEDSGEKVYKAGESFTEMPGHVHEPFNAGDVPARVVATTLLVKDAKMTTTQAEAGRPVTSVVYKANFPDLTMEGPFVELIRVLDFAPGAGVAWHSHGGPHLVTILEGAITVYEDNGETVYKAGESFTEMPGHVHQAMNTGDVPARVAATWLLSMAAPTTLVK